MFEGTGRRLPVFPDQRTFSELVGMSQRCQTRTSPPGHLHERGRQPRRPLMLQPGDSIQANPGYPAGCQPLADGCHLKPIRMQRAVLADFAPHRRFRSAVIAHGTEIRRLRFRRGDLRHVRARQVMMSRTMVVLGERLTWNCGDHRRGHDSNTNSRRFQRIGSRILHVSTFQYPATILLAPPNLKSRPSSTVE